VSSERACYQVRVAEVVTETNQACSLVLDIPAALADVFAYQPGQFLTVRVPLPEGGSVRGATPCAVHRTRATSMP